jgi:hypothetical protein
MTRWLALSLLLLFLPAPAFAADTSEGAISIAALADTKAPYQNQSVLYTIRVVARAGTSRVSLSDIQVANAIVERQGEPEIRRSVESGAPVNIIQFHFIITPLQPGPVTVPPAVLKGDIDAPDNLGASDPLGGSFMASMLRAMNAISAFAGNRSFSVASNATVLNVKPPAVPTDPWLPLASLKISEDMSAPQSVRVGDSLTRKITLLADGAVGSQLPDVEDQQSHGDFRVYTDKTVTGQGVDKKTGFLLGWRTESFSLVAQKPGAVVLPAIRISWWNAVTNTAATAELPARTIKVLPGSTARSVAADNADLNPDHGMVARSAAGTPSGTLSGFMGFRSGLWQILAAATVAGLLFAVFWWLGRRHRSNAAENSRRATVPAAKPRPRKPPSDSTAATELKHIRMPEELQKFLQRHAHQHWGTARNASLERIFAALTASGAEYAREDIDALTKGVSAALYAGRAADMEDLKKRCRRIITASKRKRSGSRKTHQKLACLNPD